MVWSRMDTRRIVRSVSTPIGIAALSAALVFALMVALRPITPRIAFNDGLGYDGQYYAAAVRAPAPGAEGHARRTGSGTIDTR